MPFGIPSTQFPKEEGHDIRETFADSLSQCLFDGQALRLEFCSTRLDETKPPPAKPTGKRHVVARMVLTPEGAVELFNACMQMGGAFKQAGILKETPAPRASGEDAPKAHEAPRPPVPSRGRNTPTPSRRPGNRLTTASKASNRRWRVYWAVTTRSLRSPASLRFAAFLASGAAACGRHGQNDKVLVPSAR